MKFAVSNDQRDYFRKNGILPIMDILQSNELKNANDAIDQLMRGKPASEFFRESRDLWRSDNQIKRIIFSKRLMELAFELIQKKPFRIAFDQLLVEKQSKLIYPDAPFQDSSCISELLGLYLLVLKNNSEEQNPESEAGSGYFFLPHVPFPFSTLPESGRYLLIGYAGPYSQYLYQPKDPQGHYLKKLGYVFGDKLNEQYHPTVLR